MVVDEKGFVWGDSRAVLVAELVLGENSFSKKIGNLLFYAKIPPRTAHCLFMCQVISCLHGQMYAPRVAPFQTPLELCRQILDEWNPF